MNQSWEGTTALVTGATGIVGSWLVKQLLDDGARLVVLMRDWDPQSELVRSNDVLRTTVVQGSLEDLQTIRRAINDNEVDTVFHLGAQTLVGPAFHDPIATFESNVRGTYNVLEACRLSASGIRRVVVASSDKAYGTADRLPYTEDMPLRGRHPYDVSKTCADLLGRAYAETYRVPVAIARCGNIYGGGDLNWSRIVPGTIRSLLRNQRPVLRSDGTNIRDYVYVLDVVAAYIRLALGLADESLFGAAFNFSAGRPLSVMEITNRIRKLMGRNDLEPVVLSNARAEIGSQFLDSSRARETLKWRPCYELDSGLTQTIDWYQGYFRSEL